MDFDDSYEIGMRFVEKDGRNGRRVMTLPAKAGSPLR